MNKIKAKLASTPRFYIDIAFLFIAEVLWALGFQMYRGQISVYMNEIVGNPQLVSFIQSVGNFSGILALAAGFLSRKINLKWLVVLCWGVTVPAPLLFALAQDATLLLIGQFLYSLTTMFGPAVILYIFDYDYPGEKLSVYLLYCLVSQIASVAGPSIGGGVATLWGMRGMLLVVFVLFALSTLSTMMMSSVKPKAAPDAVVADGATLPAAREPFSLSRHLRAYASVYGWMFFFMTLPAIQNIAEPLISVYLADHRGLSPAQIGYGFTGCCLGGMLLTLVIRKYGQRAPVFLILSVLAAIFALADLGFYGVGFWLMLAMLTLRGASKTVIFYAQGKFTEITEISAGAQKGMFVSAFIAVRSLLMAVTNNIGGSLYVLSPTLPFTAELAATVVWVALFAVFARAQGRGRKAEVR
ncbi:MAG: MFS transporter [Clostridiaceae bacterium]|nr:MFS transporter [Clostridiaceae bacterium]